MATTKHGAWSQPTSQADQAATLEDSNMPTKWERPINLGSLSPLRSPQKTIADYSRLESSFMDVRHF